MMRFAVLTCVFAVISTNVAAATADWAVLVSAGDRVSVAETRCKTTTGANLCSGVDPSDIGTDPRASVAVSTQDGSAFASADLATGELKISGTGGPDTIGAGAAGARLQENLIFDVPGLGPNDLVPIGVRYSIDGTIGNPATGSLGSGSQVVFIADFTSGSGGLGQTLRSTVNYRPVAGKTVPLEAANPAVFVTAGSFSTAEPTLFQGTFLLSGSDPTLRIDMSLQGSGIFDLANTVVLDLILPDGASFTSSSGVFLSARDGGPDGVIPLPASGSMMLLLLGAIGLIKCMGNRSSLTA